MKATETYLILCQMDAGEITLQEAHELILHLFDVGGLLCPRCNSSNILEVELPKTTEEFPYIEFKFNKKGKLLKLSATNDWWGGINGGFSSSKGHEGNTCEPKDLNKYINAYKNKKIKTIVKELTLLKNKLNNIKNEFTLLKK
jgi:hypothetical protein